MGISFKLSKTGSRFVPKPTAASEDDEAPVLGESIPAISGGGSKRTNPSMQVNLPEVTNNGNDVSISSMPPVGKLLPEQDVSFNLTLYQNGYCIGGATEIESVQPAVEDGKSLHPYDRASETLFSAIESGWLPGDILDDLPIKYYNGSLICEVRDYRKHGSEQGTAVSAVNRVPVIHKVQLRMSLENIVKDMHSISDDSWTYSDLMEVESRIVKALQPNLHLDPTPRLDQLCKDPIPSKLNLGIRRKRRLLENPEVIVISNNQAHGKKICIDKVPDIVSCKSGDPGTLLANAGIPQGRENMTMQHLSSGVPFRPNNFGQETSRPTLSMPSHAKLHPGINSPAVMHDRGNGFSANFVGANANMASSQNLGSFTDTASCNTPISMTRENIDGQVAPLLATKRSMQALEPDNIQNQQAGSQLVGVTGSDMQWKNQLLQQQRDITAMQYSSALTAQRYPSPIMNNIPNQEPGTSFYFSQQGLRYGAKEEQIERQELERRKGSLQAPSTENSALVHQQSQPQNILQHPLMRNHPPNSGQWQHVRSVTEKDMRKDDGSQRRKSVPSPRVSPGPMVQSPVSSKSGEISSGSMGGQFSAIGAASALGSQKDKLTATSNVAIGTPSVTSSPSDSMHRQHQGSMKRKTNPAPKTQSLSGVGSPASVSNMNAPLNANSPSIGTGSVSDQEILERFAKIEVINQRYQLNSKKKKVDDYPTRKPVAYRTHELALRLSDSFSNENHRDQLMPISKSLIGGTINTLKSRTVKFIPVESLYQVSAKPQLLIMNESPFDGTVTMQYGDLDNPDTQDYHLTLPTTHSADLLAAQFCALMEHNGYENKEDHIRPMQIRMVAPSNSLTFAGISENAAPEVKPEIVSGQAPQVAAATASVNGMGSLNTSQNFSNNTGMLACVNNNQTLTKSHGYLPGTSVPSRGQQADQSLLQQQLQQNAQSQLQHQQQLPLPHIQRSTSLLSGNPLSQMMGQTSNLQMNANHMVDSKPTPFQLQMLQQAQQQQQAQPQRKVMMGPNSSMSMGNMQNNITGLAGLSNAIGMGGVRGISSSLGPISGLSNITPNNLGAASNFGLRGPLTQIQTATLASKLRMAQPNRAGAYGPHVINAMPGSSNQMLSNSVGLSMLGHPLNRTNISTMHRNAMSTMGPPKITGTNFYLNPQQQLQLQQLQQQQQQQLQQQQQQQQQLLQQQISSPQQHTPVGSPAVVGSPPSMVMQQQISPQQIAQKTAMSPQQLSSGAMQQMNNGGNPGAGPASPQLSSQTLGSVGSITSSPMEQLQGANNVGPSNNL